MIPAWTLAFPTLAALIGLVAWRLENSSTLMWKERHGYWFRRAQDAIGELGDIKRHRSETTRKGNATRSAKRKALQDTVTAQLEASRD